MIKVKDVSEYTKGGKQLSNAAWTAKIIRQILKEKFPKVKFSIVSDTFSMGNSVDIKWRDGPTVDQVDRMVGFMEGAGFDGSIDLKYNKTVYLVPRRRGMTEIVTGSSQGSSGSRGYDEPYRCDKPKNAKEVSFADYIQCSRSYSKDFLERFAIEFQKVFGGNLMTVVGSDGWGYALKNDMEFNRGDYDRANMVWRVLQATELCTATKGRGEKKTTSERFVCRDSMYSDIFGRK